MVAEFAFEKTRVIQLNVKPSVGRIVHYVSYGTPGGEYTSKCRAAVVTELVTEGGEVVGLCVLNPTGIFFCESEHHEPEFLDDDGYKGGTWHWPERVE